MKLSDKYKYLYHYTTYLGLEGILNSNILWATHYQHLNDSEELLHAKKIIVDLIFPKIKGIIEARLDASTISQESLKKLNILLDIFSGVEPFAKNQAEQFVGLMYANVLSEEQEQPTVGPFIFSFCAESKDAFTDKNGLLSQWRGYGGDGGYCIEFLTEDIENLFREELGQCFYPVRIFDEVAYGQNLIKMPCSFQNDLEVLEEKIPDFIDNLNNPQKAYEAISKAADEFVSVISRSKHYGFREENEVRMVFFSGTESFKINGEHNPLEKNKRTKKIFVRNVDDGAVPYIKLFDNENPLPIKRIIVGPHRDKLLRKKSLEMMLNSSGIKVDYSDIPFLGF